VLAQPKRLALLIYLTVARPGESHRRDHLLPLFWPDLDDVRARDALNQALRFLRQWLGAETFTRPSAEEVGVDPTHFWCDAVRFQKALDAGRPDEALERRSHDPMRERKRLWPLIQKVWVTVGLTATALAQTRLQLVLAAAVFGLGFGNQYPAFVSHVLKFVDPARRGAAFGGILAAFDTGIGTGSIATGWMAQQLGFRAAFGVGALLSAFSIPYFLWAERRFLAGRGQAPPTGGRGDADSGPIA